MDFPDAINPAYKVLQKSAKALKLFDFAEMGQYKQPKSKLRKNLMMMQSPKRNLVQTEIKGCIGGKRNNGRESSALPLLDNIMEEFNKGLRLQ